MKNEKGFSLIEVLVALALLGIIGVAFMGALSTASKAMFIADERATAESLARSQMEYIKNQEYSDVQWSYKVTDSSRTVLTDAPSWWDTDNPPLLSNNYAGYSVEISAEDFDADGDDDVDEDDEDIRKIIVTVSHHNKPEVIILEGYKVNR